MRKISVVIVFVMIVTIVFCSCGTNDIQAITVEPSKTLTVGDSLSLNFSVQPENASKKGISWSSSNDAVVTVKDGSVKAQKAGEADVTVTSPNGVSASCHITVNDIEITKIVINPSNTQIKKDSSVELSAKIFPSTVGDIDLEWVSNNDYVATVDSSGNVSGLHKGTAVISCIAPNGKSASCTVKVTSKKKKTTSKNNTVNNYYINGHYTPEYIVSHYRSDFVFPYSSSSYLSTSDVSGLNSDTIQKAINEIYARNGYIFKNKSIRAYYEQFSWYYEDPNFSTSDFNSYEKSNLALLQKYR